MKIENVFSVPLTVDEQTRKLNGKVSEAGAPSFEKVLAAASVTSNATVKNVEAKSFAAQPKVSVDNYRRDLVNVAKADESEAEQLLDFNTSSIFHPLIDISSWPTVRYSVTGEVQTPESMAYFAQVGAAAVKDRAELVRLERGNGTPAAQILDKVLAFNSALPPRFKEMANIFY